jgi:hypothetical protein
VRQAPTEPDPLPRLALLGGPREQALYVSYVLG